jgi:hypothetical protein
MKKIISILIGLACALSLSAQTYAQKTIECPAYTTFWGATTDTITSSGTNIQAVRLQGNSLLKIDLQLDVTKTSGTVTNNLFIQKSMDGTNWTNTDTIALSNASTSRNVKTISNWNTPYIRFYQVAPATAQLAYYKLWFIARYQ